MLVSAQQSAVTVTEAERTIRAEELQLEELQQLERRLQSAFSASVSRQRGRRRRIVSRVYETCLLMCIMYMHS